MNTEQSRVSDEVSACRTALDVCLVPRVINNKQVHPQ